MSLRETEADKYRDCWGAPEYRLVSHSLKLFEDRPEIFPVFNSALDIGCGAGRLLDVWNRAGIETWGVDIAENCLDPDIAVKWSHCLRIACLWEMEWDRRFDLGICCDVMEHIPPEHVDETIRRIGLACNEVIFKIAHEPNGFLGHTLHLTLHPWSWWVKQLQAAGGSAEYLGIATRANGIQDSVIRWRLR